MKPIKNTSPTRLSILIALAFAALLPGTALAGTPNRDYPLPDPKTTKIEIPGSLGGIELGQTKAETVEQWGNDGTCKKGGYCFWGPPTYPYKGGADISFEDGVVSGVEIRWTPQFVDGKRPIRRSITRFHTAEGIRLKSTAKEAKKAFPENKLVDTGRSTAYKFETAEATMYIFVGFRFVERINIYPPGFAFDGEESLGRRPASSTFARSR